MVDVKMALLAAASFLRENPGELWTAVRNLPRLRFGMPVSALSWLATELETARGPREIVLESRPPGIHFSASVEEMKTWLRVSACITVESVVFSRESFQVVVALSDVKIRLVDEQITTPLGALIRSGALDLTRIANLVAHMPKRPAALVEAVDNRLVLDLMRVSSLAKNHRLRQALGIVSSLLAVRAVETDSDHLNLSLQGLPQGLSGLIAGLQTRE